jgi:RNA polymerase sigma-70 factor (ECF subfamily)
MQSIDGDSNYPGDAQIVHRVVAGDVNAFEHLLKRYQNYVFKIVQKHVPYEKVEDVAQEVFIGVYQSLPTFKKSASFRQWLSTIAVRTCYEYWRKHYRSRELPMSSLAERHRVWLAEAVTGTSVASFHEKGLQQEAREILDWGLAQLSAEDRMVLELVYLEGYSVKEAARLLGWSTANVKVRSFRSRKKLCKLLMEATAA